MGLITWMAVVVTILAIMGLGWNVLKKMTEKTQQLAGSIIKNGSEEKLKDPSQTTKRIKILIS
jgi:hypothetical protein